MTDPNKMIPPELLKQWEDGSWLGSCDWGHCDNDQAGWAWCGCDDPYCGPNEWLASCAECLERGGSKPEAGDHRIGASVTFKEIEATNAP